MEYNALQSAEHRGHSTLKAPRMNINPNAYFLAYKHSAIFHPKVSKIFLSKYRAK